MQITTVAVATTTSIIMAMIATTTTTVVVRVESVPTVDADIVVRVAPVDPRPACAENPNRKFRMQIAAVEAEADPEHDLVRVLETSNATGVVVLEDLNRGVLLPLVVWGNRHPVYEGNRAENSRTVVVVLALVAKEVPDRRRRTTTQGPCPCEKHDRNLLVRISEMRILD